MLWTVYETRPLKNNDRKQRVFKYVVVANSGPAAVEIVRERTSNECRVEDCVYRVEQNTNSIISINILLQDVPSKKEPPKNVVDRLGTTERGVLESIHDNGFWGPGCGWMWDTYHNTGKLCERLLEKGYLAKDNDRRYTLTLKARLALSGPLPDKLEVGQVYRRGRSRETVWGFAKYNADKPSKTQKVGDQPVMGTGKDDCLPCGNRVEGRLYSPRDLIEAGWIYCP